VTDQWAELKEGSGLTIDGFKFTLKKDRLGKLHVHGCDHSGRHSKVRQRTESGRIVGRKVCEDCGTPFGSQIRLSLCGPGEPIPFDADRRFYEARNEAYFLLCRRKDEERKKESDEWWLAYDKYLGTDRWRDKRRLVLKRCDGVCEGCRLAPAAAVHHLTYERVGRELLFDLVALCHECHNVAHSPKMELVDVMKASGE
jgi:5-methylcytosine-specific restriction endonuclease McrA